MLRGQGVSPLAVDDEHARRTAAMPRLDRALSQPSPRNAANPGDGDLG